MNSLSKRGKRGFKRTIFTVLPALLLCAALMPVFLMASAPAGAMSSSDVAKLRGYIGSYINNQFGAGASEGEDGFLISAATLHSRLNSFNDGSILGEGDDAASAPVLVDNLGNNTSWIPGTSNRCMWNTGAGGYGTTQNCFDNAMLDQVKARADAHAAAGFSTDVVVYCLSGNTEAPTTGAFGYIAQTGRLRGDGSISKVYALKWGRNGWTNTVSPYTAANPIGPFDPPSTYTPPASAPTNCNSVSGDAELVRCEAQWAIYNGTINGIPGGNVGGGQIPGGISPNQTLSTSQIVDIRSGGPAQSVMYGLVPTVNLPINTIFGSGMINVMNPATSGVLIVSRTPMAGGITAEGLKMLGYSMSPGGFLNGGLARWNSTIGEKQVSDGLVRPGLGSAPIDITAPTIIAGPTISGVTSNSADISRITHEPATSKIHLVGSDSHVVEVNNTVLNASKTVIVSGLHPGVAYSGTLTAYDGQANGTAATIGSFTIPTPPLPLEIHCPPNQELEAMGPSGAVASFGCTAAGGVDPAPVIICSPASGSMFPVGTTVVHCMATDLAGNTATCSFTVTVLDPTPAYKPDLALIDDATGYWGSYSDYVQRQLSVVLHIKNRGTMPALDVAITGSTNIDGANLLSAVPVSIGTIPAGSTSEVTLRYFVPVGRSGILVRLLGSASDVPGNSYSYP